MQAIRAAAIKVLSPSASSSARALKKSNHLSHSRSATMATTNDACCGASAASPVRLDYNPKGKVEKLSNGTDCYIVGTPTKAVLVLVPDIFGLEFNQSMQVSDRLVDAVPGLACAMPDVFRGAPWKMSEFPPTDKAKFMAFIDAHPWDDSHVKRDVKAAFEALEARAADGSSPSSSLKRFTMGFCWGAMMALLANADAELKVDASAGAHPTFFGKEGEIAKKLRGPVLLLPTKGDPGEAVLEAVKSAGLPFADACRVRRFDDQVHGFMAARGDYKDEKVRAAAGEGVGEVAKFFGGLI